MRIIIISWGADQVSANFAELNEKFCTKNGYEFVYETAARSPKGPDWENLFVPTSANPDDVLVYVNSGVHFYLSETLARFLETSEAFVFSEDIKTKTTNNLSDCIFICRVSEYTQRILDHWKNSILTDKKEALNVMYRDNIYEIKANSRIIPYGELFHYYNTSAENSAPAARFIHSRNHIKQQLLDEYKCTVFSTSANI